MDLYRMPFFVDAEPAAPLPTVGAWLQGRYLKTPPEFWSIMGEIRAWNPERKYVADVFVVTVEDDAVVLAVEYRHLRQDVCSVELVSNKPIAA
jgi:hypothetical protein